MGQLLTVKPAVLVTKRVYPEAIELLQQYCEVDYEPTDDGLPASELLRRAQGKQAIVSQLTDKFTRDVIAQLKGVRVIANVAVGYDNVDLEAATEAGILVTNTPDVLTDTTADLAFALLLAVARRVVEGHHYVHSGQWKKWAIDLLVGHDVHHKVLGIVGFGRIGRAVARRARGFDMQVLYTDPVRAPVELETELHAQYVPLDELLRRADFVSLHVPLSDQTRHLIGTRELQLMKPTAILINTARGPIVDEAALVEALEKGLIAGAGLDVFEHEPQVHPGLLRLQQVVLTPHIGSASIDTRRKMCLMAAQNALAALRGERPPNLVNAELWHRLQN